MLGLNAVRASVFVTRKGRLMRLPFEASKVRASSSDMVGSFVFRSRLR